ncbi:type IV secretion protein Rhs [Pseudomonas sp. MTM4]|uniref:phospholipase effector Tle1 domain-containing protein n=1 Tax=unclassified Pseudomonas TaxID=196821 RepID=UPI0018D20201|nr:MULTISPECIES: DUF2235 domain-containing protein [unclassified Pseudomonas]MBC8649029.1 type IV secretion protein Rhs [Pseudomonas sp. MT4]QXY92989.1 type IV secretion protein Rhs [Pseudomonas sp. MTM4]
MSGKPAARLGDPTACPKTGHGNNPIATGSPDVLFDSLPAARLGDATGCGSALSGNLVSKVLINGKPAATLGSVGAHGDVIVGGSGTVVIGNASVSAPFTPPAPLNLQPAAQAQAFDRTTSLRSPHPPQPTPSQARALEQADPGRDAPHGLEEEEEEEELDCRQAVTLRIGVFFDGTGNNASNSAVGAQCRASDIGLGEEETLAIVQRCEAHHLDPDSSYGNDMSNIWRLYDLYQDDSGQPLAEELTQATLRIYVTGIGTTTGEKDSQFPGQALGRGDTGVEAKVDEGFSLITQALDTFQQTNPSSVLGALELDIFGFSRGAAAARHFANQVNKRVQGPLGALRRKGKFVPGPGFDWHHNVTINFIGLFDTVAAIGGWNDWANPSDAINGDIDLYLAPDAARQVVHLVARDEHRRNFSLNRVSSPHREIMLPGAHSDLGGGYLKESVERLYLVRPRRNWVSRETDPLRTLAYQQAQQDTALAHQADLLDPQDHAARLATDAWEYFPPLSGSRNDQMKYVIAAPYLERTVYGHLSRVYLRVMHALAVDEKVPFKEIPETEDLIVPEELLSIGKKLLARAMGGSGLLDEDEERLLRQRYIHLSSNWNAAIGQGGGRWSVVFVNAPAENGRVHHDDTLGAKR